MVETLSLLFVPPPSKGGGMEISMKDIYKALDKRIKSTDFPLQCRAMYYFAKGRHAHQNRKVSGYPYFVHPRAVAYLVMKYGGTIDQINAAFAHDLLEDTETSYPEIEAVAGTNVANLCTELRNNRYEIEDIGKTEYITQKLLHISEEALLVKLADIYCNMSDSPAPAAKMRMLENVRNLKVQRDLSESMSDLVDDILQKEFEA